MKQANTWTKRLFWAAGAAAAIYSWTDFLWPPVSFFRHTEDPSPVIVLVELLKPANKIYEVPFAGYLFLALTAVLFFVGIGVLRKAAAYVDFSTRNLSIITSEFEVNLHDVKMQEATLRRVQSFHANRSGISAYRSVSGLDTPGATLKHDTLASVTSINGDQITKEVVRRNTPTSMEIIEAFDRDLPTSLLATFLPNPITSFIFRSGGFRKIVATRVVSYDSVAEYNGPVAILQVTSPTYPATHVTLRVCFPEDTAPDHAHLSCFVIKEGAVRRISPTQKRAQGRVTYEVSIDDLYQTQLRLQWSNERLHQYIAANPQGS